MAFRVLTDLFWEATSDIQTVRHRFDKSQLFYLINVEWGHKITKYPGRIIKKIKDFSTVIWASDTDFSVFLIQLISKEVCFPRDIKKSCVSTKEKLLGTFWRVVWRLKAVKKSQLSLMKNAKHSFVVHNTHVFVSPFDFWALLCTKYKSTYGLVPDLR